MIEEMRAKRSSIQIVFAVFVRKLFFVGDCVYGCFCSFVSFERVCELDCVSVNECVCGCVCVSGCVVTFVWRNAGGWNRTGGV